MYVVVAGAGEVGRTIARALRGEGHDVVVVDRDPVALEPLRRLDVLAIEGGAGSPHTQKKARVDRADVFLGVTGDDEANLIGCTMAKAGNPKCRTVARVNGLDYMHEAVSEAYQSIGCDVAVCPEIVAAQRVARLLDIPSMVDADVFAQGRVQVMEARLRPGARIAGQKLKDLKLPPTCKLVAIFREDEVLVPGGGDALRADDRVLAVVKDQATIRQLHGLLGDGAPLPAMEPVRRVLVVGATRVGVQLARLLGARKEVKLIDRDPERARVVSEQLPEVMVVQGDAADRETLVDIGIADIDAVVSGDERDEFNILTCLLAKQLGVSRTVAIVQQGGLKNLAERIGIDLAVSPRQASVGTFLRFAQESAPVKLQLLAQGEAQVMEFEVHERSKLVGDRVRKAGFPKNSIVGAIVRGKEVIVPGGDDFIQAGDRLVVFALTDVAPKLHKMF